MKPQLARRDSAAKRDLPTRPSPPLSLSPSAGPSLRVALNQLEELERSLSLLPLSATSAAELSERERGRVDTLSRSLNELTVTHARLSEQGKRAKEEAEETLAQLQGEVGERMGRVRVRLRQLNPELESAKYTQSVNARRAFFESMQR